MAVLAILRRASVVRKEMKLPDEEILGGVSLCGDRTRGSIGVPIRSPNNLRQIELPSSNSRCGIASRRATSSSTVSRIVSDSESETMAKFRNYLARSNVASWTRQMQLLLANLAYWKFTWVEGEENCVYANAVSLDTLVAFRFSLSKVRSLDSFH